MLAFQVHLWLGIGIGIYVFLIGLTGSVLVFREEIEDAFASRSVASDLEAGRVDWRVAAKAMRTAHPEGVLASISWPTTKHPYFRGYVLSTGKYLSADVDPRSGKLVTVVKEKSAGGDALAFLQQLHVNLFFGRKGRVANGVGAALVLVLCGTGLILWWRALGSLGRSLRVDFRRQWKRVIWDIHSVTGFWMSALLVSWSITGIYFVWPTEFRTLVNRFSAVSLEQVKASDPSVKGKAPPVELGVVVAEAQRRSPGAQLLSISFPADDRGHIRVYLDRESSGSFDTADSHYFDPYTGRHVAVWQRGISRSLGDLIMNWVVPLHFGTFGGHGAIRYLVKGLWAVLGLGFPVLMGTGFLMYWNRFLRRTW